MFTYKGFRCFYLGLCRWKVTYKDWRFDILCRHGISELINDIDRWEHIV